MKEAWWRRGGFGLWASPKPKAAAKPLRGLPSGRQIGRSVGSLDGLRQRIAHDLLQLLEIRDEARAAFGRQPIQRLRAAAVRSAPRLDESSFLQHVEVTAQVAVRQRAQPFQ